MLLLKCKFRVEMTEKVMVPPLRTSQKPSTHRHMKRGASSRIPETMLLLHVKTAGVNFSQIKQP